MYVENKCVVMPNNNVMKLIVSNVYAFMILMCIIEK